MIAQRSKSSLEGFPGQQPVQELAAPASTASTEPFPDLKSYRSPKPRRFIQVFCRYLKPGGEEVSVARIATHLEAAGHEVVRFWRASAEWQGPQGPASWRQPWLLWKNQAVLEELEQLHRQVQPDAWLFHNIIPVISLGVFPLARRLNVPIIRWTHNYRPISPSGTMRAGGKVLRPEDPWLAWKEIQHGTWHGLMATAVLALGYSRLRQRKDFDSIKVWLALSEEMRQIFLRAGFPEERFFCLRHSWDIQPPVDLTLDEGYFLVLGRMVEEKGVRFIVDLWRRPEFQHLRLVMAGEGPLVEELRAQSPPNVEWVGYVRGEEKRRLIAGCRAVLFPCLWPEPLGLVVYEAYEQGKPVLGSATGGLKEVILDGQTGRQLPAGDAAAWTEAVLALARQPELSRQLGLQGRKWLEEEASPDIWNRKFDEILAQVEQRQHLCEPRGNHMMSQLSFMAANLFSYWNGE